jgi:hypothetical protein
MLHLVMKWIGDKYVTAEEGRVIGGITRIGYGPSVKWEACYEGKVLGLFASINSAKTAVAYAQHEHIREMVRGNCAVEGKA